MRAIAFVVVLSIVFLSTAALADVPGLMSYQGTLTDAGVVALDTTVDMTFTIYTDSTGGSQIWTETQPSIEVSNGLFNVLLGRVNALSADDFSGPERWLAVQVGGDPELEPRQRIGAVGYAFWAEEADTAEYARSSDGGAGSGWVDDGTVVRLESNSDSVVIGATSPLDKLHVVGSSPALRLQSTSQSNTRIRFELPGETWHDWEIRTGYNGFFIKDTAAVDDYVTIKTDGKVGIGTTDPSEKLHIRGSTPAVLIDDSGGGLAYLRLHPYAYHQWEVRAGANGLFIKDSTAGSDYLMIQPDGDVGIGTISPAARLDVRGTLNVGEDGAGHDVNFYREAGSGKGLFWDASQSALRAGYDSDGTHWAPDSVGLYSFAAGYDAKAKGLISVAMGENATASGVSSVAIGNHAQAIGDRSVALGTYARAYGGRSLTGGYLDSTFAFCGGVFSGANNLAGNEEADTAAFVGGGWRNAVESKYSTIGGGKDNTVYNYTDYSVIGGGENNTIHEYADHSVIGGGENNHCYDGINVVAGGIGNTCSGDRNVVCGGGDNRVDGWLSSIGGGLENYIHSSVTCSAILGGEDNVIWSHTDRSTIAGGWCDTLGNYSDLSMVFGHNVYVDNEYRVVFFDGDDHGRLGLNRDDRDGGISYPIHVGTSTSNGNGALLTNGGTWTDGSSRTFKENFQSINSTDLLSKIDQMPVEFWQYKDTDERHIGPVAEDFVAAFDVGPIREDGTRENQYLAARDVAGVALAGVKELLKENRELKQSIEDLKREIAELKRQ